MPKRGPLRGVPAKRKRVDSASSKGGRGKPPATAAKSAPFALKWDEDVESGDESADDMVQKKPKRPLDEDEDEDDEEMDPEEHRKRYACLSQDFCILQFIPDSVPIFYSPAWRISTFRA